jgi:AraC family transcriptional regulator, alkane utilization regulator
MVLIPDIRMDGVGFSVASLKPPFCVSGLTGPVSICYVVRNGPVWLEVEVPRHEVLRLEKGTVAGLSGLVPHWFKSAANSSLLDSSPLSIGPLTARLKFKGPVDLFVGHVPIDTLAFTSALTGAVIIPPDGGRVARRMKRALEDIEDELRDPDPAGGAAEVVQRLSEIILMNFARWDAAMQTGAGAALGALSDTRVMRAIAAAARAPLEPWTVARMAEVAGMSRTAFARHFRQLTGDTPLNMLAQIRLRLAAEELRNGSKLDEVATLAGYGSAAAFTRAFRRFYRTTPARWREAGGQIGRHTGTIDQ